MSSVGYKLVGEKNVVPVFYREPVTQIPPYKDQGTMHVEEFKDFARWLKKRHRNYNLVSVQNRKYPDLYVHYTLEVKS